MKKSLISFVLVAAVAMSSLTASAINFGVRGGLVVDNLKIDWNEQGLTDAFNDRLGWQVGLMLEVPLPLGLAIDGSVMYMHHELDVLDADANQYKRSTINIPVNLKYKLNIIGVGKVIKPMIYTGPEFGFLLSNEKFSFNNMGGRFKKFNTTWNFGFGVELFNHVQVTATYCLGLNKSIERTWEHVVDGNKVSELVEGTNRYWTVTAAVLF